MSLSTVSAQLPEVSKEEGTNGYQALIDTFTIYSASAVAATTIARSVFGAVLPIFGLRMYKALGLGWGNSLLGFIGVVMIPVSVLLVRHNEFLRTRFAVRDL